MHKATKNRVKPDRLTAIRDIISQAAIGNQEELLNALKVKGFTLTQATLSRDLKKMKLVRTLNTKGKYQYQVTDSNFYSKKATSSKILGVKALNFSGNMIVLKTQSGYAGAIAADLDAIASDAILATIAGDDTVLIIPKETYNRQEMTIILKEFIELL